MAILDKIKGLLGGAKSDPVTSGHDWKGKTPEEVSEADRIRSQEEMKQTFGDDDPRPNTPVKGGDELPDGSATALYEDVADDAPGRAANDGDGARRGQVELLAGNVKASVGTEDNPASPSMGGIAGTPSATMTEDEPGGAMPREGLGLDDGPVARKPTDAEGL